TGVALWAGAGTDRAPARTTERGLRRNVAQHFEAGAQDRQIAFVAQKILVNPDSLRRIGGAKPDHSPAGRSQQDWTTHECVAPGRPDDREPGTGIRWTRSE